MRFVLGVAAAAVLMAVAGPSAAQDARRYVAEGDGGRYVKLLDPKTQVAGHSAAIVQAFRARMDQVIAQLDAMPQLRTPPPGICHQLASWIEVGGAAPRGPVAGAVEAQRPLEYRNGACIRTNNGLVSIGLNRTADVFSRGRAMVIDAEGVEGRNWWVLGPARDLGGGRMELRRGGGGTVVVMTRPGASLVRPVSARRYLAELLRQADAGQAEADAALDEFRGAGGRLAEWRRKGRAEMAAELEASVREMAGALPPAQLAEIRANNAKVLEATEQSLIEQVKLAGELDGGAGGTADPRTARLRARLAELGGSDAPACLSAEMGSEDVDLSGPCPPERQVVELNPGYYDASRPGDVQLLTLATAPSDPITEASRRPIMEALDLDRLQALVR
jgi:hypothetical protein